MCAAVEAPVTRKIGSIADYDPGATPVLSPAYQPVGISMRQRQEWEETVPISSSAPCMCSLAVVSTGWGRKNIHCTEAEMCGGELGLLAVSARLGEWLEVMSCQKFTETL